MSQNELVKECVKHECIVNSTDDKVKERYNNFKSY